ncbi:pyrimidine-nucleoside phosphorylase [Loigolactobacillus zhaoyuanensis]|uniref:Pyrimidine-nucleoside phosphorylase n=1 Tax=Loigolactobacillus zhaoyuanensis TaxID=2486017 RepID=A0ABW8UFH7_9LACO|nr:pyrimidine-nucleoside phosphorylase [Loigolactobacillus zhaoyuanensis]
MLDLINKRRRGEKLTTAEITFMTKAIVAKEITAAQVGAFLDTFSYHDMTTTAELTDLTMALAYSGGIYDLSDLPGIKVAPLSTDGLGDKTSLVLLPLVASVGVPILQVATPLTQELTSPLTRLAAIPQLRTELAADEFVKILRQANAVVAAPVAELAPLQQKLAQLESETDTAQVPALMASRLLSLAIAAGADALVVDIKTGNNCLTLVQAQQVAKLVVAVGTEVGRRTLAVVSDLNQPVGNAVGASWEIREVIATLKGGGPADLRELALSLGAQLAVLGGYLGTVADAREQLSANLENGQALAKFRDWIAAQAGNADIVEQPDLLATAEFTATARAPRSGYVAAWDMAQLKQLRQLLGTNAGVGFVLHKKIGDSVEAGEALLTIYSGQADIQPALKLGQQAATIADTAPEHRLLYDVIDSAIEQENQNN